MTSEETYYTIALTRMTGLSQPMALQLYRKMGGGQAVYEHRDSVGDVIPNLSAQQRKAMLDWDDALRRAAAEMEFAGKGAIRVLTLGDDDYPLRLRECPDAPLVLYYRGTADLNQARVINMVGTRHCTPYGQDLVTAFLTQLHKLCPQVLVVSGLAYGIDICAHRQSLALGYETVGVLAHGLDQIYPPRHRDTAISMVGHGGLLTEYMSMTEPMPNNFRQRNRIVAGMSDATILVESAVKGGGLITCRVALEYDRDVFAFPGNVGQPYSEGCNRLIARNNAALITSAQDFVEAMGWHTQQPAARPVERQLFPDLTAEEQLIVDLLGQSNDLQLNIISVRTNIAIGQLTALLFSLEMKGVVKPMAGGTYHLLMAGK